MVAQFSGCMEFGPRALGNRSIIALPTKDEVRKRINSQIKRRPNYQPFCPSVLDIDREMLRYPSATVFWFKPKALNHQQFRSIQPEFFPEEPIPIDGTSAHSLERLIPYISMLNEFQTIYYFDPSLYLH